jgi:hypothetical protein
MRKRFKRIAFLTAVTIVGAGSLQLIAHVAAPGHFELISSAEAIVGRPLTPMSVAGVARRTAYRSAVYGHPYPVAAPYPVYHY